MWVPCDLALATVSAENAVCSCFNKISWLHLIVLVLQQISWCHCIYKVWQYFRARRRGRAWLQSCRSLQGKRSNPNPCQLWLQAGALCMKWKMNNKRSECSIIDNSNMNRMSVYSLPEPYPLSQLNEGSTYQQNRPLISIKRRLRRINKTAPWSQLTSNISA